MCEENNINDISIIIVKAPMRKEAKKILRDQMEKHQVHKFVDGNSKKALDHFFANTILMTNIPIYPMIDKSCIIMNDTTSDFFIYMKYGTIKVVRYQNWVFCTYDVKNTFSTIFRVKNVGETKKYYSYNNTKTSYDEPFVLDVVNSIIQQDKEGKIYNMNTKSDHMQQAVVNQTNFGKSAFISFIKKWIKGEDLNQEVPEVTNKNQIIMYYRHYYFKNKIQPIVRVSQSRAVLQTNPNKKTRLFDKLGLPERLSIHSHLGKSIVVANLPVTVEKEKLTICFCYLLQTRKVKVLVEKINTRTSTI